MSCRVPFKLMLNSLHPAANLHMFCYVYFKIWGSIRGKPPGGGYLAHGKVSDQHTSPWFCNLYLSSGNHGERIHWMYLCVAFDLLNAILQKFPPSLWTGYSISEVQPGFRNQGGHIIIINRKKLRQETSIMFHSFYLSLFRIIS